MVNVRTNCEGQGSLEYVALLAIAAAIVVPLVSSGPEIASKVTGTISHVICTVTGSGCKAPDGVAAGDGQPGGSDAAGAGPGSTGGPKSGPVKPGAVKPVALKPRGPALPRLRARAAGGSGPRARGTGRRGRIGPVKKLKGRRVNTDSYKKNPKYCKLYDCKQPLKMVWKVPHLPKRNGKLRFALFIKNDEICGAPGVCGNGDDRGFDKNFDSSRVRVMFSLDFKKKTLTMLENPTCSHGKLIADGCSSPRPPKRLNVTSAGPNEPLKIDYAFQNSRIPKPINPSIDGVLKIYKDANGDYKIKVNNDNFPSLEAYYDPAGKEPPRTICQDGQSSPKDLVTTGDLPKRCSGTI